MKRTLLTFAMCAGVFCELGSFGASRTFAQGTVKPGPQTPTKAPEIVRLPAGNAAPEKPPIPAEEIIRRFAAQEDEMARVIQNYGYRKTVRVQEFANGEVNGQSEIVTAPVIGADGRRAQRTVGEPQSTLQLLSLERDALESLAQIPAFPLGSAQLSKYQITYQGMQPVDELTTFVFRVKPLQLERSRAYFDGLIWVDNHDMVIVKSYGQWVTDGGPQSPAGLPFTTYETYRQPVANKYWLPAFSQSDSSVSAKSGSVPVRLVIRWDNYTPVAPSAAPTNPAR